MAIGWVGDEPRSMKWKARRLARKLFKDNKPRTKRDPDRIPRVMCELQEIWEHYPDLRLGQLILNVVRDPELYHVEDDVLIREMRDWYIDRLPKEYW